MCGAQLPVFVDPGLVGRVGRFDGEEIRIFDINDFERPPGIRFGNKPLGHRIGIVFGTGIPECRPHPVGKAFNDLGHRDSVLPGQLGADAGRYPERFHRSSSLP